jgi:general secretion pathway protein M
MNVRLDKKRGRALAVAILIAIVAVILALTAGPVWMANASRQAALDQAHERLQRYRQIAARDAELLPQYETLAQNQKTSGKHLRSDTVAVAGAELQRRVSSITSANQAQVTSTQILPPSEEQGFVRITLRVRLRGTLPAILQSLYDIETHDVYMFVDNVGLADNLLGRNRAPAAILPMDAQFDLVAYMPEES